MHRDPASRSGLDASCAGAPVTTAPSALAVLPRLLLRRRNERAIEAQALVRVRRMPLWKASAIALSGLVVLLGLTLAEMVVGGMVIHAVSPTRSLDIFFALHNQYVVGALVGVSLLWVLPPHPWAKETVDASADGSATEAAAAEAGDAPAVTALTRYREGAPPASAGARGVGR